jgi:lipid A 3-O-deacylase
MNLRDSTRLAWHLIWLAGVAASCARQTWAQPDGADPEAAPGTHRAAEGCQPVADSPVRPGIWENDVGDGFRRGVRHFGFGLGIGLGAGAFGGKERHELALGAVRFGRMLGGLGAEHQWYRGNSELIGELWGGAQYNVRRRNLFGLTPLLRYNFATRSPWVPFVNGGVGVAYSNIGGPDLSNGFQFNVQVGAGARYFYRPDTALTFQYRWFHLSNAGLNKPNTGLNSQVLFAGLERFF